VVDRGEPERIADRYLAQCLRQTGHVPTLAQTAGAGPADIHTERPRGSLIKSWTLAPGRTDRSSAAAGHNRQ
jgi:hypothetical protein